MALIIFVSSCATTGEQAKLEGTGIGALLGAAGGAALGAIACGGNVDCIVMGAATGAVAGGIGGYMYADNLEKHHQALKGKEHDLDTQIKVANNINGEMQAINQKIQTKITELNQDISSLQAEAESHAGTKEKLAAKKKQINEERNNVERALESAKKERDSIASFHPSSAGNQQSNELKKLVAEQTRLEENIKQMEWHSRELASMSQRL